LPNRPIKDFEMGLEFPPVSPATCEFAENDGGGSLRPRHSAVEMALRELCDLQAQATRLAVTIQSIDLKQSHTFSHAGICDERFVRSILRARLDRGRFISSDLFADPAWDMLLALYAAELGQQRVPVSSLCVASNVPMTTALRWIAHLEREKLIARTPDPLDARRFFLSLTRSASEALAQYFAETPRFSAAA
jgi:DNA-binding MarR family transcriptional regulator